MDDAGYGAAVSLVFKKLVKAVDAADPDVIECDATGDMVTITATKTGEKVIVNVKTFMDGHRPPDRVLPSML